jgi:Uri superfamily endonuclease
MKARSEVVKGAYFLVIFLTAGENRKKIPIGKLGTFYFPAGFYIYVGSALNGLDARITRHLSKNKKKRWHIDYFLDRATVIGVALRNGNAN